MPEQHQRRRSALRARLAGEIGAVPLLVTDLANIRYLSGFSGSNAILVIGASDDEDLIATDGRYVDQVAAEAADLPAVIDRATLTAVLGAAPTGPVAVERELTVAALAEVRAQRGEPVVLGPVLDEQRCIKDEGELACLARACTITGTAFDVLAGEIRVGMSERQLARRLEQLFGELGAEDRAFPSIVASGVHAAIPHHRAGERQLVEGDLLVIDAGARVEGYHADMTRTWIVGREPEVWQADLHGRVLAAQEAARAAVQVGQEAVSVDQAARRVLREAGLEERFTHGLGHGVGLQIHEAPSIGARATGTIMRNMAFTVEPGVYLPGRGGVRIEDTLVVTDAGSRVLTEGVRDLRVVGV